MLYYGNGIVEECSEYNRISVGVYQRCFLGFLSGNRTLISFYLL